MTVIHCGRFLRAGTNVRIGGKTLRSSHEGTPTLENVIFLKYALVLTRRFLKNTRP